MSSTKIHEGHDIRSLKEPSWSLRAVQERVALTGRLLILRCCPGCSTWVPMAKRCPSESWSDQWVAAPPILAMTSMEQGWVIQLCIFWDVTKRCYGHLLAITILSGCRVIEEATGSLTGRSKQKFALSWWMVLHRVPRDTAVGFMKCWAIRNCRVFVQKNLHLQCAPSSPHSYDPALTFVQEKRDVSVLISMCCEMKIGRWLYLTRRPKIKAQNLEMIHLQKT